MKFSKLGRRNWLNGYKKYQYKLKMDLRLKEANKIQAEEDEYNRDKTLRKTSE